MLAQVLRPLVDLFPAADHPEVVAGLGAPDDAAVYRLGQGRVVVVTLDVFPPVVDGPEDYGAIAAANSMSDVWAMGADPVLALNIALLPADMPPVVVTAILGGAAERVREAGAVIAGGHTMDQKDPVFGLAVIGLGDEDELMIKGGLAPGQHLVLTKPLGSGVLTTAGKRELLPPAGLSPAIAVMRRLNQEASRAARRHGVRCATDITGFGLAGHAMEMAKPSGVGLEIHFAALPLLPDAMTWAERGALAGGAYSNLGFHGEHLRFDDGLGEAQRMMLFDPQTSGGLLLAVDEARLEPLLADLRSSDPEVACIGRVVEEPGIRVLAGS